MREILFRGKRISNSKWVKGFMYSQHFPLEFRDDFYIRCYDTDYLVIPETVGQYTGLTDKNGRKIFEGDIVKAFSRYDTQHTYAITYRNGVFWFGVWNWVEFIDRFQFAEVVGNIHDNPDILKGGEDNG